MLALEFDMLPESLRDEAAQRLVKNIQDYDFHLTTGFLGTPYLCHVLSDFGYAPVAYRLLMQESIAEIDSIGVQVKDLESGLLDFPCRVDDEVVLLCWRMGESSIEHWHTMESGFQGRRPVDERFRRRTGSSSRPN